MGIISRVMSGFTRSIGIDLGTANTLLYVRGQGILVREPSVLAFDTETHKVLAVGEDAKSMLGRTPGSITAVRPLKGGSIADFKYTEEMLRGFIFRVYRRKYMVHPTLVVGVPLGITDIERRAVIDAGRKVGAQVVFLIEEPMAAAIGAGLPVAEPVGSFIVDIGGGTTEIAVISLGGIVLSKSVRTAGNDIIEAITAYIRKTHNLLIGERTAEEVCIKIGSVYSAEDESQMTVKGRDLFTGLPGSVLIESRDLRNAVLGPVSEIVETVKEAFAETPPELASDIAVDGIYLTGGGSLLKGIDKLLAEETGMPVHIVQDPLSSVAIGAGKVLDECEKSPSLKKALISYEKA